MDFKLPPIVKNEKGEIRKVGFELEYAGIDLPSAAQIIADLFGGSTVQKNKYSFEVQNTTLGDFSVMLDARVFNEKSYEKVFDILGIDIKTATIGNQPLQPKIESWLESAASKVIPYEIVTPPVPITELETIERLRVTLHEKDALGSKAALEYAFGAHINPEVPSTNVAVILHYLQAFLLLYPWLSKVLKIDFTRRLTTFINPFPDAYVQKVLYPRYQPGLDDFIDDYVRHNPDRNRPLDMYPLFVWLREEKIKKIPDIGKVSGRPTFHYRMPNCTIDNARWSIAHEWNFWIEVEKLANDTDRLNTLSKKYLRLKNQSLFGFEKKWFNLIEKEI